MPAKPAPRDVFMPVLLALAGCLAAAANWLAPVPLWRFAVLIPGIVAAVLLSRMTVRTAVPGTDYLQSGEGSIALLAALLADRLGPGSFPVTAVASIVTLAIYELYLSAVTRRRSDALLQGAAMNGVAVVTVAYLALRDGPGTASASARILTGFLADSPAAIGAAAIILLPATLLYHRFAEEMSLHGQGRPWYAAAWPSWQALGRGIVAARIIVAGIAILGLGFLGGTACAIAERHRSGLPLLPVMLLALFCQAQMLMLVQTIGGTAAVACGALALSYLLYGLSARDRRDLYDRCP